MCWVPSAPFIIARRPLLRASRAAKLSKFSRQEQTGRGGFPAAVNPTRGGKQGAIIYLLSGLPVVELPWVRQFGLWIEKLNAGFLRRFHSVWKSGIFLLSFGMRLNCTTFQLVIPYSGAALTCLLFDRCQRGRPPWVQRVANRNTPRPGYEGWISQLCLEWRVAYR